MAYSSHKTMVTTYFIRRDLLSIYMVYTQQLPIHMHAHVELERAEEWLLKDMILYFSYSNRAPTHT